MNKKKLAFVVCLIAGLWLNGCSRDGKHVIKGVVANMGSCGGGEGYFSGNHECAVKVKTSTGQEFWNVYGQVVEGQTIYKHCWKKDGISYCFSTAYKYIRKNYRP